MSLHTSTNTISYNSSSLPGVRVPLGVCKQFAGGKQNYKTTEKKNIWVEFCDTILIWGYAQGYNSYLGVRTGVKFRFGGTEVPKGWEPLSYTIDKCSSGLLVEVLADFIDAGKGKSFSWNMSKYRKEIFGFGFGIGMQRLSVSAEI